MEHGCHAVVDEGAPEAIVVGMRERTTVDERGRHHREVDAGALEVGELATSQSSSRIVTSATGCTRPRPSAATDLD